MIQSDVDRVANWWKHNKDSYPPGHLVALLQDEPALWGAISFWERGQVVVAKRPAHRAKKKVGPGLGYLLTGLALGAGWTFIGFAIAGML